MRIDARKQVIGMALLFILILLVLGLGSILSGCTSQDLNSRIIVTLTDAPGDFDAVYIDVEAIEIHNSSGDQDLGWTTLPNTHAGVYDLLDLTNGVETLLADTEVPAGRISQMRVVLGNANTLVIGDRSIDLKIPSGASSGLKLNINEDLVEGLTYTFKLDFDAARSVVKSGESGTYILKPVIRVITETTSGAIAGTVSPASEIVAAYAMQGPDTLGTSYAVEDEQEFLIGGLAAGSYTVVLDPGELSTLQSQIIENVVVVVGSVTEMDPVTLE